jgi:hypothetical protein
MTQNISTRALRSGLGALAMATIAIGSAQSQGWRGPTGTAQAARVSTGGVTTTFAASSLPSGGGIDKADEPSTGVNGLLSTGSATSVTSGTVSSDMLGAQGVATAADVNILNGRITASRVIAIALVSEVGNRKSVDGDGTNATGLTIDGVSYSSSLAPNTRVELPGAGYAVLNEQLRGRGRGISLTVNMIHVYLTNGSEIVVASVTSGNGS